MESFRTPETRAVEFEFSTEDVELEKAPLNPEAYQGCLVQAMRSANAGNGSAREAIDTTVISARGNDLAMACGRCGITLVRDNGIVYGASRCFEVRSGRMSMGELA